MHAWNRPAVLFILALAGASTALASSSRTPSDAFRGCSAPDAGPDGWVVACEGAVIGIADGPGDGTCRNPECLQRLIDGFAGVTGAKAKPREAQIMLAGASRRLIQLDGTVEGDKPVRVLMAVIDRREGRRVLNCLGDPSAEPRCRAAFEAMAGLEWRAEAPAYLTAAPTHEFAGRPFVEPAGCTVSVGPKEGVIQCDDSSTLVWMETGDPAAAESKLSRPYTNLKLTERPAPCAVDGTATTCRSFRPGSGKNVGGDLARVDLRGRTVVVSCTNLDPGVTHPKACSGLLTLSRPGSSNSR
jgi:hypothetical protein